MKISKESFEITSTIKSRAPVTAGARLLYAKIKNSILGKNYNLSLVFVGERKIRSLNRIYRKKDRATDVLSFPLSKTEGEIFINFDVAAKEAKKFGREINNFVIYLVIHASCHLKGMTHGSRMEALEQKYRKKFQI